MTRQRQEVFGSAEGGEAESINFTFLCPSNMILKTVKAHWADVPVTPEDLTILKSHPPLGGHEVWILRVDPSECELNDFTDTDHVELIKGDLLTVQYANTDDTDCAAELILEQV